jgi:hypothetical protein
MNPQCQDQSLFFSLLNQDIRYKIYTFLEEMLVTPSSVHYRDALGKGVVWLASSCKLAYAEIYEAINHRIAMSMHTLWKCLHRAVKRENLPVCLGNFDFELGPCGAFLTLRDVTLRFTESMDVLLTHQGWLFPFVLCPARIMRFEFAVAQSQVPGMLKDMLLASDREHLKRLTELPTWDEGKNCWYVEVQNEWMASRIERQIYPLVS